ncbi:hypothetical protein [Spirosoma telluris]|uniref:hypothetical protein n=1 Tax=Spirosoma telluris TaxID=2183553 RepID=UPI002FC2B7F4
MPVVFDFESPEQLSIRTFYAGFGAETQAFWSVRWSRLTGLERALQSLWHSL